MFSMWTACSVGFRSGRGPDVVVREVSGLSWAAVGFESGTRGASGSRCGGGSVASAVLGSFGR